MEKLKTSVISNGLLWFGAGISIAEILTGMLVAPLGFRQGAAAIILGHIIGGLIMYGAGLIGARTGLSAMETVRLAFGRNGSRWFAFLNVIQLIGWTAVMIAVAAVAADVLVPLGNTVWSIVVGAGIALWIVLGLKNLGRINIVVMAALFGLTVFLSHVIFQGTLHIAEGSMTFGGAVELAVAMPLSWLPVIADYTRTAERPAAATAGSCLAYFIASCWMFFIGMGAVLYIGNDDLAGIMAQAGMGIAGIIIILLSTVTTTFLDALSAGISSKTVADSFSETGAALVACIIGVVLAVIADAGQFEAFLYLIGSVFAPMTAILLADYFILGADRREEGVNVLNIILWIAGFCLYRQVLDMDTPLGVTFPVIVIIMFLSIALHKIIKN